MTENRYMVQLLNLVVHAVCAPALQNSGFAVCQYLLSASKISVGFPVDCVGDINV